MAVEKLSEFWRRVLGHLPVYAEDEAAHIEAEGGRDVSIRAYSLPDFTARLAEDVMRRIERSLCIERERRGL